MEVFDQAEEINFYSKMFDYLSNKEFYYDSITSILEEKDILKSLYEYANSQYYGFDKTNY